MRFLNLIQQKFKFRTFIAIILFTSTFTFAKSGSIKGHISDAETGNALVGANIVLKGTSFGAVSDIEGNYYIANVPSGSYEVTAMYIGYNNFKTDVQLSINEEVTLNLQMKFKAIEGEEVEVTAQAEGQMQAINQQLSSRTVKNVVSSKQIQQLPESNAAEAVGRLPGVSLERSGGEGNKVVIRGMAPKYSLIQIDGVTMAATGQEDRSTDLSMISPYMLEGIELTKSIMANQEATATGGIVNFRIRKAPEGPRFNVIAQGGYNNLRGTYNDFKISTGASNRFFSNIFGIYTQVDYEEKDAGSQQLGGVGYSAEQKMTIVENDTSYYNEVRTNSMQLRNIFRNVKRLGATVVFDLNLPSTKIKSTNFYSRINKEEISHHNTYDYVQNSFSLGFGDTPENLLGVWTNALQIDHRWRNWEIEAGLSHSYSVNEVPFSYGSGTGWPEIAGKPFSNEDRDKNFNIDLDPETIPDLLQKSIDDALYYMSLGGIGHNENETFERDFAGNLDAAYNLNITKELKVKLNLGGKYKYKSKEYDQMALIIGGQYFYDMAYEVYEEELSQWVKDAFAENDQFMYVIDFWDQTFDDTDFFDGRYEFSPILDVEKFRVLDAKGMESYDPETSGGSTFHLIRPNFISSIYNDYHGNEEYFAFYFMPEIEFLSKFVLIPGVRYESNRTEYTGYRGNRLGVLKEFIPSEVDTVTKTRKNEFFLPMIQTFYKPLDWVTFKLGYTHTLQRPNYNNIMPGWMITNQGQIDNLSNFRLKPELSRNWDFQISVHSGKIGLFSAGIFHKKITDMIFWTGQKAILDTAFFELPSLMYRQRAAYATNNQFDAYNYGYEIEWQSNFWYLPGLLKGLVVNFNYTRNKSTAEYLRTRISFAVDPITYEAYLTNNDTSYTSPMISQPDHLLNFTVGYDYKGFSIRGAMRFKSHIFKSPNWYEDLRVYSTDFYRYDISIKQKIPVANLEFFLNINNLTNEREKDVINHMDFVSYIEDYGRTANIGLRYEFK